MQPNAVFASIVDRKPYEHIGSEENLLLTARSSTGTINSSPFKEGKVSNLMFGTREDSVELMMHNSSTVASSSKKCGSSEVYINEQSSHTIDTQRRTGKDPGYLLPNDFTGELS